VVLLTLLFLDLVTTGGAVGREARLTPRPTAMAPALRWIVVLAGRA